MKQDYPFFPHRPISFRMVGLLLLISAALVVFSFALNAGIAKLAPPSAAVQQSVAQRVVKQLTIKYTLGAMAFWVAEELIFRGYLLQKLRRHFRLSVAVSVSSGLFALEHAPGGLALMVLALLMGLYCTWLMIKTDSIYAPIAAHWAFDFSALYVYLPLRGITAIAATGQIPDSSLAIFPWYAYPLATIVIVVSVRMLRREFKWHSTGAKECDIQTIR